MTERQKQIVDIAMKLIAEKGIKSLTIKNIANQAGFTEPALYRHFNSKYEIIMALLDRFQEISEFVLSETEKANLTSLQKIEKFLFDRYQRFSEQPYAAQVMFSEGIFREDKRYSRKMLQIMHQHAATMQEIIREGQINQQIRSDIKPVELFRIIFGSLRLLVNQWCLSDFAFDLQAEGQELWHSVAKLIV